MSIACINWAISITQQDARIGGTRAHVLLLLANRADERRCAWQSAATLAAEAGITERTVRAALADLEAFGVIAGERRFRYSTRWTLLVSDLNQPEAGDPNPENSSGAEGTTLRKILHGNPENSSGGTVKIMHGNPEAFSDRTIINHQKNHQGTRERRAQRGMRLPADWIPSASDSAFARERGLDPDHIAECFRDYWHAKPGAGAAKSDWSATWRNWCRRERPAGSDPRRNPRTSARVDSAAWLAGLGPEADAAPNARVLIDPEGNPQ